MKKLIIAAMLFSTSAMASTEVYKCEGQFSVLWDLQKDQPIPGTKKSKSIGLNMVFDTQTGLGSIDGAVFYDLKFTTLQNGVYAGHRRYIIEQWTTFVTPDAEHPAGELRMFSEENKKVDIYKCYKQN